MTTEPELESPSGALSDAPDAAPGDPERLAAELAEAQARAQEHWNSYLRAVAVTEDVRKRAQRDVEAASRYAIDRFAGELLEVRDSLELGLAAGASADPARLLERMEASCAPTRSNDEPDVIAVCILAHLGEFHTLAAEGASIEPRIAGAGELPTSDLEAPGARHQVTALLQAQRISRMAETGRGPHGAGMVCRTRRTISSAVTPSASPS